jgi:D-serine dehydratase
MSDRTTDLRDDLPDADRRRVFDDLVAGRPTVWLPEVAGTDPAPEVGQPAAGACAAAGVTSPDPAPEAGQPAAAAHLTPALIDAAEDRFRWFAPLFEELFPETRPTGGIIESPLQKVGALASALTEEFGQPFPADLWVKRDDALAVSGSVKSRGGIHEVLEVALDTARDLGIDLSEGPTAFLRDDVRTRLSQRRIVVGSTGNLGLSIGLMSAILGFSVTVHMSQDAKAWKKTMLRTSGVDVVEHATDFTQAVHAGRASAEADPAARSQAGGWPVSWRRPRSSWMRSIRSRSTCRAGSAARPAASRMGSPASSATPSAASSSSRSPCRRSCWVG